MEEYINMFVAQKMYEEEVAKRLELDLETDYGRNSLIEYLKQERIFEVQTAISRLKKNFPGKFIKLSEIRLETDKIKREKLKPYFERIMINQNGPVLTKK